MMSNELNMNWETVRLIVTEKLGDEKNLLQDGVQPYHTAIAGCAVECWCYLIEQVEDDLELMDRVITGDENWSNMIQ
jgi:hypothetical protein